MTLLILARARKSLPRSLEDRDRLWPDRAGRAKDFCGPGGLRAGKFDFLRDHAGRWKSMDRARSNLVRFMRCNIECTVLAANKLNCHTTVQLWPDFDPNLAQLL